jgi:release factor glutamine methyltransferase
MNKIWRIIDIIKWAEPFLDEKGVDSPRLTIELLLAEVLQIKRLDLYLKFDQPLLEDELEKIRAGVKRLAKNEPLQYIIGHTEFYGLKIITQPGVLIPRPETEQLVEMIVLENKDNPPTSILDIGTGSGCIALSLAKAFPQVEVFAIDVSDEAIKIAENNQRINKISNIKFFNLNILEKIPKKIFPLIVSNPPYIASNEIETLDKKVKDYEPNIALSDLDDGFTFYRRFSEIFQNMLEGNGKFYLELNEEKTEIIEEIFKNNSYAFQIRKDYFGKKRFLVGNLNN